MCKSNQYAAHLKLTQCGMSMIFQENLKKKMKKMRMQCGNRKTYKSEMYENNCSNVRQGERWKHTIVRFQTISEVLNI